MKRRKVMVDEGNERFEDKIALICIRMKVYNKNRNEYVRRF